MWSGKDHFGIRAKVKKIGNGVAENTAFIERCKEEWSKFRDEFNETTELDTMDTAWMRWKMKVKEIGIQEGKTNEERTWKTKKRAH